MKFSESWLRSLVNPALDTAALSHLLTMAGLEVEELDPVAPAFTQVVVAQVKEVVKHPDADRLNVCQVDVGGGDLKQIVCGAPNVAPGLKVPCAQPGAVLPGDFTIKVAKVRGIESSGMLCSAKELGVAEESSGLLVLPEDAPVGVSVREYLDLDDQCFTLKLTPNRADCLSLTGIAREVAALTGTAANLPAIPPVHATIADRRAVALEAPAACPRYCGRIIRGVDAKAATPDWMVRRLERSGIRSISVLVDITNYVMLELGQPLHAFDDAKLTGTVRARLAKAGEQLEILNGQTLTLSEDVLVIADDAKPLAVAGIMGGEESGITLETRDLFLESAFFAPAAIAGRARRYGFSSDASHRFERGVDFELAPRALERATQLVLELCGGQAGPVEEARAELPQRSPVRLRPARVAKVLGIDLPAADIARHLHNLGLDVREEGSDYIVTPPSYRFDIEIEEDLIEELARLHGYDNIPSPAPQGSLAMLPLSENHRSVTSVKQLLASRGYQEVVNFAFVEEAWEADFAANTTPIRLANPIASQLAVMRTTLIAGLVENLSTNLKRKQNRVRLFEAGRCFWRDSAESTSFRQPWKLAGLAYGGVLAEQWGVASRPVDFYDLKADLEFLLQPVAVRFEKAVHPALHPGRSARVCLEDSEIGVIGELHPEWVQKYDLPVAPLVFELDLAPLTDTRLPAFAEVSKYQAVVRDLAVVLPVETPFAEVMAVLGRQRCGIVQDIQLFDVYTGKGVGEGEKSLAFRIVMQDTQKTLQDAEVDAAFAQLLSALERDVGAKLRT